MTNQNYELTGQEIEGGGKNSRILRFIKWPILGYIGAFIWLIKFDTCKGQLCFVPSASALIGPFIMGLIASPLFIFFLVRAMKKDANNSEMSNTKRTMVELIGVFGVFILGGTVLFALQAGILLLFEPTY